MAATKTMKVMDSRDRFRTGKAYSVSDAAFLAKTTTDNVRRWLLGYEWAGLRMSPLFGEKKRPVEGDALMVSFLELVEIVVVSRFRRGVDGRPVSLDRLRQAHAYARDTFHLAYPFASLPLMEEGGHIMRIFDLRNPTGPRLAMDVGGQWALPIPVQNELSHLDFDEKHRARDPFALRWFPEGRDVPIVIDPHIAAGRPTIKGRGITIATVAQRHRHGEPVSEIASDYELDIGIIEEVLRHAA